MHELAICQALLGEVTRIAEERGAGEVTSIVVSVGPLSGVEPGLLSRAFEVARAGSIAARAGLVIEPAPLVVRCRECGAEGEAAPQALLCPSCGGWRVDVVSGDDLLLRQLTLTPLPGSARDEGGEEEGAGNEEGGSDYV
jgi:hydrogenase nickel incorporation protein HypA/HybF